MIVVPAVGGPGAAATAPGTGASFDAVNSAAPAGSTAWAGQTARTKATALVDPQGVAVAPDGDLWVADGDDDVKAYTPDGRFLARITGFDSANHIAVGPDGDVWVSDGDDDKYSSRTTIRRFATAVAQGAHATTADAELTLTFDHLTAFTVDPRGDLWVGIDQLGKAAETADGETSAAKETSRVVEFTPAVLTPAAAARTTGSRDTEPYAELTITGFTTPRAIAVTTDGTLWVDDAAYEIPDVSEDGDLWDLDPEDAMSGTNNRLTEFLPTTLGDVSASVTDADAVTWNAGVVEAAAVDSDGHVWTVDPYLEHVMERDAAHLSDRAPLATVTAAQVWADNGGPDGAGGPTGLAVSGHALWITACDGLSRIDF